MKLCPKCHTEKPFDQFYKNSHLADGHQTYCKVCATKIRIAHYRTDAGKAKKQAAQATYRAKNADYLKRYLATHPCIDCGEADLIVLEFDHRDQSTKVGAISNMVWSYSLTAIKAEVAKCDVRCANCHRRRTAVQLSYRRRI